jgi:Tfp pilus assembly protein PilN
MTLQQIHERRPKKIDLNLLPSEYRPVKRSKLNVILYMTTFVLVCAAITLIVIKLGVDSDIKDLNGQLASLQQQLSVLQANKNEADVIKSQISDVQGQLAAIEANYQTFLNDRYLWSQIITEIDDLVPGNKITLSTISISAGNEVSIAGISTKRINVYDYVLALEESDFFTGVDFTFGDCPETENCQFTITAPLSTLSQTEGEGNE